MVDERVVIGLQEYYMNGPSLLATAFPGTIVPCKIVAVVGQAQDWAAYWGPSNQSDEEIATGGDKIGRTAAEAVFPTFKWMGFHYRP